VFVAEWINIAVFLAYSCPLVEPRIINFLIPEFEMNQKAMFSVIAAGERGQESSFVREKIPWDPSANPVTAIPA
jgi:hypothetical protein